MLQSKVAGPNSDEFILIYRSDKQMDHSDVHKQQQTTVSLITKQSLLPYQTQRQPEMHKHTHKINQSINHKYSLFSGCSFISEYSRAEVNRLIWDEFTCQQTAVLRFSSSPEECDPLRTGAETFCSSVSFTFQFSNSHMLFRVWRVWKIQVSKNTCE